MIFISHTTITSTTQRVDLTSIPQTYKHLYLVLNGRGSSNADWFAVGINGDHTGSNYRSQLLYRDYSVGTTSAGQQTPNSAELPLSNPINYSTAPADTFSTGEIYFYNYTGTTLQKTYSATGGQQTGASPSRQAFWETRYTVSTSAITSIRVQCQSTASNSLAAGTTITLYGLP